tara:strand:- start:266 stop:994 length:729 start_codon:yes stop_codon:yes gene_type:complete
MIQENYNIKLNNFEGPMDLLLYFINRDRIDIYDIPISQITNEYLAHINMMKMMDIDVGADFIYMSTLLLQIKAKMLLPKAIGEIDGDVEDPRVELVHRLLEYKRFKKASDELDLKYNIHKKKFSKGMDMNYNPSQDISLIVPINVRIFDLAKTFKNILDALPENNSLDLALEEINIKDQMSYILDSMDNKKKILLTDLISKDSSRIYVIGLFLAILELIRVKDIDFKQTSNFSNIELIRVKS